MIIEGRVWKFGDNISTDLIIPTEVLTTALMGEWDKAVTHCMKANRPGWAMQVQRGDIIVGGINFGCGSSRPGPRVIQAIGISVVVVESMSRLFFRNAVNIGLPVMLCKKVTKLFEEGDIGRVNMETGEVVNVTEGGSVQGEALPADSPPMQILQVGGLIKFWEKEQVDRQTRLK